MAEAVYHFGGFVLDAVAYRLLNGTASVDLSPKAVDLLLLFVRRPGQLVTKDDILAAVWPDVAVTDNALTQVISDLRQALGDRPSAPSFIETVPRRGYRFVAKVETKSTKSTESTKSPTSTPNATSPMPGPALVVADFHNVTGDPECDWLGAGIAETLTNDLRAIHDLRVMDRGRLDAERTVAAARAAGADLVVLGGFQRVGPQLRVTARVVDAATGESRAQAKADGSLTDVFALQDAIVSQLSAGLQLTVSAAAAARMSARETGSLDAYRALTEGRIRLEMLDPAEIPAAIAAFEHALALDERYALAHVGLAHAHFWQFQATRTEPAPDADALRAAVDGARRAIGIDPELAEAHSALGFFLAGAERREEGIASCRRAVAIEPGNWRHQFRLGMAVWGGERLSWLEAVAAQYPSLAYAHFGRAMVEVARGALDRAEQVLRQGIANERRSGDGASRFPASGLHGLLGLVRLAQGDAPGARVAFDREIDSPGSRLFSREYALDARAGNGFALLAGGDAVGAATMFENVIAAAPAHARALIGQAMACRDLGALDRATATAAQVKAVVEAMAAGGRVTDAALIAALGRSAAGQSAEAIRMLDELLGKAPYGSTGWTIPIEPALAGLRSDPAFHALLAQLASRAR